MSFTQTNAIEVKQIKGKGRGVFARRLIHDGEVIERVPVLVLPVGETRTASGPTRMSGYCFEWGRGTVAVALGYGSLYNHSYQPNARYDDESGQTKVLQGNPGYRTGRGDRGQLQRRAGGRDAGLVQGHGERAITEGARTPRSTSRQRRRSRRPKATWESLASEDGPASGRQDVGHEKGRPVRR